MDPSSRPNGEVAPKSRKPWEEPQIVLERLLLVSAQDVGPGGSPFETAPIGPANMPGVMGPLGTSGGSGTCL